MLDVLFLELKASPVAWAYFIVHRGLGISKLQFFIKKTFSFKTLDPELDPDPQLEKMPDPYPDPH